MRNLSRLPSDPQERIAALTAVIRRYEAQGIFDTVYHRLRAEAEAEAAIVESYPEMDEEE